MTAGWECPRCGRVNAPHVDSCTCTPAAQETSRWCPCNPALGGSGICGCVLAGPSITRGGHVVAPVAGQFLINSTSTKGAQS